MCYRTEFLRRINLCIYFWIQAPRHSTCHINIWLDDKNFYFWNGQDEFNSTTLNISCKNAYIFVCVYCIYIWINVKLWNYLFNILFCSLNSFSSDCLFWNSGSPMLTKGERCLNTNSPFEIKMWASGWGQQF